MEIETLRLIRDVARAGGFAAAARARNLDPSTVSRAVASAEATLGARLFHRTTRRLSPTEAGALYLARLDAVLTELDRAGEEARGLSQAPMGVLRLTASVAFASACVAPLLRAFRAAAPGVSVELIASDFNLDLVGERIDLALRLGPNLSGDLTAAKLMDTPYAVVASPAYLAAAPALAQPADLSNHRCLRLALQGHRDRWRFRDGSGREERIAVAGDVAVTNPLALKAAATAGLGPALLADWLTEEDRVAGRLVRLFPTLEATATEFGAAAWAVYPSRAFLPGKTRAAIDFFRARLRV